MRRTVPIGLALAACMAAPAAAKLRPAAEADLRCLGLLASVASQSQGDQQRQAYTGLLYFLGRLDSSSPGINLATELRAIDRPMTKEIVEREGKRCTETLNANNVRLRKFGEDMSPKK